MEGIVESNRPSGFLNAALIVKEESFGLAHLDRQDQLSWSASQRRGEPPLQGSQRDVETIGQICRCERLSQLLVDKQGGSEIDPIRAGKTWSKAVTEDGDGGREGSAGSKVLTDDR